MTIKPCSSNNGAELCPLPPVRNLFYLPALLSRTIPKQQSLQIPDSEKGQSTADEKLLVEKKTIYIARNIETQWNYKL